VSDAPQSYAHHTRWDPAFHFFVLPMFAIAVITLIVHVAMHHRNLHGLLMVVFALAVLTAVFKIRLYPLKVQDRVIRLEERLRMNILLPEALRSRMPELTESQLIALRFASDGELPGLVQKTLSERLSPGDIKKAIKTWRADDWRI
jgi:hypothetical protein